MSWFKRNALKILIIVIVVVILSWITYPYIIKMMYDAQDENPFTKENMQKHIEEQENMEE